MLTTYALAFHSFEDFNNFITDLNSYNLRHLVHIEDVGDRRYFIVILHKCVYNHYKVREVLGFYNYSLKSFNRSLSSLF